MGLSINNILTNKQLYEIATAKDAPGATLYSDFNNYEDFAKYAGALSTSDARQLANTFTTTSFAWYLEHVYVETGVNYLEEQGFGKKTVQAYYGMLQKMYLKVSDCVDPKFIGVQNGEVVSPFINRNPETQELFYTFTDSYQNYITISDQEMKTAFASETGVAEYVAGVLEGMTAKFVEWELNKELDTINVAINSVIYPLSDEQKITVPMASANDAELKNLSNSIKNTISAMCMKATAAFNAGSWKYRQKKEDLVLLIKPIYDNALSTYVLPYTFKNGIEIEGIKKIYTDNFGGLVPTVDGTISTKLVPVYDSEGRPTHTYSDDAAEPTIYQESAIKWYDPNEDVIAVLIDADAFFEIDQNPMHVYPIFNPRTERTTYFFNKMNIGFHFDKQRNIVVFRGSNSALENPTVNVEVVNKTAAKIPVEIKNSSINTVIGNTSENPVPTQEVAPTNN